MVLPTILFNFQCVSFIRYSNEKSELKTQLKYRSSYFLSGYFYLARRKILSMSSSLTVGCLPSWIFFFLFFFLLFTLSRVFFSDLYKFSASKATRTFRFSFVSVGCHYNKNHDGSLISINLRDCIETGWNVCCCFPNILIMFIVLKSCGEFRRGCRVRAR